MNIENKKIKNNPVEITKQKEKHGENRTGVLNNLNAKVFLKIF